ncbi:MAG: class I SAM-dependent methyltransferase [Lachnospiraceae bacterium]|nr:class I SAM-dependent methyltransferase [Lachnospiraceae bacterium]
MKEYIGSVCLDLTDYEGVDRYSDGAVEDELLEIVKSASDAGTLNKIIEERKSWPLLYHLSPLRYNIIESIPIRQGEKVLEIGAGCGAITGILAEKAGKVTCIELSKKRSMINAYRNQGKNIEIKVGNFETVHKKLQETYDVITLIGVFEYAQSYIDSPDPFVDFLKMIEGHLSEQGRVILAIENQYGLKYWAGCREDHVNQFFSGLEGYPGTDRARTFGRDGLCRLLKKAGLSAAKVYYPYPDYKFAMKIYSDDYLPKKGELINNIRNYDNDRMYLFNEELVYDSLIEDGMFPFFSNSYLIVAGRKE